MSENQTSSPQAEGASKVVEKLEKGDVLGGNFRVERLLGWGGLGPLYRAHDGAENHPVALRVFSTELTSHPEIVEGIQTLVEKTAPVQNKNAIQVFGMGREGDLLFLVQEYLDGQPLRALLEKKAKANKPFTLKGAFNVVAHISNGLQSFESIFPHGAIHPGNILVSRSGRIKLSDIGLVNALASLGDITPCLASQEARYVAPEVMADPGSGDSRSDVYSMGVLLGELLTGVSPEEGFKPPSSIRSSLPTSIDKLVERCRDADPGERYLSPGDMKEAMLDVIQEVTDKKRSASKDIPAISSTSSASQSDNGDGKEESFGIEIDVVTEPGVGAPPPPPTGEKPGFAPEGGVMGTQPGLGTSPPSGDAFPAMSSNEFDLAGLVDDAASEDDEKYLIQQGKLDFGPFSFRELKVQIRIGEVGGDDIVVDSENGSRIKVKEHPELGKYFRGVQRHKELQRRAATQSATQETEKRKKKVFWLVGAGALSVVALVAGGILLYRGVQRKDKGPSRRKQKELRYETSWDGTEDSMGGKRRRRRRRRRGRGGWKGGKWDNKQAIDFGSGGGGSGERLSRGQIYSVMSRYNSRIGNCLVKHGKGRVNLRLQIAGSGKLTAVRTSVSGAADRCVKRAVRRAKFPKFNGARTTGSYSLRVSN